MTRDMYKFLSQTIRDNGYGFGYRMFKQMGVSEPDLDILSRLDRQGTDSLALRAKFQRMGKPARLAFLLTTLHYGCHSF